MGAIKLLHKRYNRMRIVSHSTTFPQGPAKPSPSFGMSAFKLINNKFLRMDGKLQKKPLTEHALNIFSHDPVRDELTFVDDIDGHHWKLANNVANRLFLTGKDKKTGLVSKANFKDKEDALSYVFTTFEYSKKYRKRFNKEAIRLKNADPDIN